MDTRGTGRGRGGDAVDTFPIAFAGVGTVDFAGVGKFAKLGCPGVGGGRSGLDLVSKKRYLGTAAFKMLGAAGETAGTVWVTLDHEDIDGGGEKKLATAATAMRRSGPYKQVVQIACHADRRGGGKKIAKWIPTRSG